MRFRSSELDASDLRRMFDESFAELPRVMPEVEDFLAIRLCSDAYSIRVREIAGIAKMRRLTPVPSQASGLLGLIGIGGKILPVFGLWALLGYLAPVEPGRWLVLAGAEERIALAFHELDGHVRLAKSGVRVDQDAGPSRNHVSEAVRMEGEVRPVISISSVLTAIRELPGRRLEKDG